MFSALAPLVDSTSKADVLPTTQNFVMRVMMSFAVVLTLRISRASSPASSYH